MASFSTSFSSNGMSSLLMTSDLTRIRHYHNFCTGIGAEGVVDDEEGSVGHSESSTEFCNEFEMARAVDEID